jgi:hypothetical protein
MLASSIFRKGDWLWPPKKILRSTANI